MVHQFGGQYGLSYDTCRVRNRSAHSINNSSKNTRQPLEELSSIGLIVAVQLHHRDMILHSEYSVVLRTKFFSFLFGPRPLSFQVKLGLRSIDAFVCSSVRLGVPHKLVDSHGSTSSQLSLESVER